MKRFLALLGVVLVASLGLTEPPQTKGPFYSTDAPGNVYKDGKLLLIVTESTPGGKVLESAIQPADSPLYLKAKRAIDKAHSVQLAKLPPIVNVTAEALQAQKPKKDFTKYGRGHKTPKNIKELHAKSWARHGKHLMAMPKVTAPTWDCRTLGYVTPVDDQGQCGSCWDVSATGVIATAFCKAGWAKNDGSFNISAQYIMDCTQNGGCNGDDASTVTLWCRDHGIPSTADYGPYISGNSGGPGNCKDMTGKKLWQIDQQGYCAQQDGIAPTQSIKDAIVQYGPVSSAVDAGGFNGYVSGVMAGDGSSVDHDVSIGGWDDNKGGPGVGCWLVKNQWSEQFGENGYCWIPYGKWSIGTSALWVHALPFAPPPPPPPPNTTPPYNLFEGTMAAPVAVGPAAGYPDVASATVAANQFSVKDNSAVMVHDAKGVMVVTIPAPLPPPPPLPPTITFTVPGYTFTIPGSTFRGPLGRSYTSPAQTIALPSQTITVPLPAAPMSK